jgi:hypothetical protein
MIFIVGYSRSGTKMMNSILDEIGIADKVPEIHFFEQFYQFENKSKINSLSENYQLIDGLIAVLERGGKKLENGIDVMDVKEKIYDYIKERRHKKITPIDIYKKFVSLINTQQPVDPTPRNAYYINNIADIIPESQFIYMVRDPRDCILSQSVKWRNYFYNKGRPFEAIRLKLNYNPSLMARFWKNSLKGLHLAKSEEYDERIFVIKYEKITQETSQVVKKLRVFLDEDNKEASDLDFIRSGNSQKWKKGFTKAELYLIESIIGTELETFGYEKSSFSIFDKFIGLMLGGLFWLKMPFAFLANLPRMKNPWKIFKTRILNN